jgi:hypothetical protein
MQEEKPQPAAKKRTFVYIDGYNLYFGVFRYRPSMKWPNFMSYFREIRPHDDVVAVRYFTAIIDPKAEESASRDRQEKLLMAFGAFPRISVILGRYQDRTVKCGGACAEKYVVPEEKKTDVNIAVKMIEDVSRGEVENIILVSGDSDLEPVVEFVRTHRPKISVQVYVPTIPGEGEPTRRNDYYRRIGVNVRDLPYLEFARHQMSAIVGLPDGTKVSRPAEWA